MAEQDKKKIIKNYSPMSEAGFLILVSLLDENHGYGVMAEVGKLTGNRVKLGAGTVYTVLGKMQADGIIEIVGQEERRKVYRITDFGRQILKTELFRLKQLGIIALKAVEKI